MINDGFLKKYQKLQLGVVLDDLIYLNFAVIGYSKTDTATYWNNALVEKVPTNDQLKEIEQVFARVDRRPTLYFDKTKEDIKKSLEIHDYHKDHEDAWLFWQNGTAVEDRFDNVRKVESEKDLELFSKIFDVCYQDNDPQNPYGNQREYLPSLKNAWLNNHFNKLDYFIIYNGKAPVGVGSLTYQEGIGYISNIGSIPAVRGKGFGKAITLFCMQQSIAKGNKVHVLATEEGEYPFEFYKRLGFEHIFSAVGYTKVK